MRKAITFSFLLLLGVAFLPTLASGGWATRQIERHLEKQLGGAVSIGKISMSWVGKQHCSDLKWHDGANQIDVSAASLTIDQNLWGCIGYHHTPLSVLIEGAEMTPKKGLKFLKKKKYQNVPITCSSIEARIKKGVVTFDEISLALTSSLVVKTWGKIDLNRSHMDLTLGLTPKALKKLFGIEGLDEEFLLEIPISCKLSGKALEKKLFSYFLKNYASVTSLQR